MDEVPPPAPPAPRAPRRVEPPTRAQIRGIRARGEERAPRAAVRARLAQPSPSTSPVRRRVTARDRQRLEERAARSSLPRPASRRSSVRVEPAPRRRRGGGIRTRARRDGAEKEARLRKLSRNPPNLRACDDEIKQRRTTPRRPVPRPRGCSRGPSGKTSGRTLRLWSTPRLRSARAHAVEGTLDLLLRWAVPLCEQAPNTQSLLKVLDFTADALAVVKDRGARLSEQEGALFLPRSWTGGHPMEAVREKFSESFDSSPGFSPRRKSATRARPRLEEHQDPPRGSHAGIPDGATRPGRRGGR